MACWFDHEIVATLNVSMEKYLLLRCLEGKRFHSHQPVWRLWSLHGHNRKLAKNIVGRSEADVNPRIPHTWHFFECITAWRQGNPWCGGRRSWSGHVREGGIRAQYQLVQILFFSGQKCGRCTSPNDVGVNKSEVNFCVLRLIMLMWPVLARPQRKNICANWNASSVTWTFQEMASFQRRSSQTCCRTFAMCDLCLRPVILSYRQYTFCAHVTWWTCSRLGFVCNATTKAWNEQHFLNFWFVFELSHLILHEMCFFMFFSHDPWTTEAVRMRRWNNIWWVWKLISMPRGCFNELVDGLSRIVVGFFFGIRSPSFHVVHTSLYIRHSSIFVVSHLFWKVLLYTS